MINVAHGMSSFVPTNQLVGEGETGHETPLLKPENSGERTREEYPLNTREGDQPHPKRLKSALTFYLFVKGSLAY